MNRAGFLLSLFLMGSGVVHARPLDAVGACPGGRITLATGQFNGNAAALKAVPAFLAKHRVATAQEDTWLRDLAGRSGRNRLYQNGGRQVVIATLCNPGDCEGNRAYIAYEPATGTWAASLYEGRHVRELGERPDDLSYDSQLAEPIACAQNLDWDKR